MFLTVETRIRLSDISVDGGYITGHSIRIRLAGFVEQWKAAELTIPRQDDGEGNPTDDGGTAVVDRLHVNLVEEHEDILFEVCDADSATWNEVFAGFLRDEDDNGLGFYKDLPGLQECCTKDILLIHDISTRPEYRGRGIEMAVARRIIDTLGAGCDLAVYHYGDHLNELEVLKPLGFEIGPIEGYAFLNLNFTQRGVREVLFCRFEVTNPPDDEKEQEKDGHGPN